MLDKKALRRFAEDNPAPAIPSNHGLLHAPQVEYIIRTAVKLIGHRRTLVLYVYDRAKAVSGDPTPAWTMFQAGSDYATLVRREDGSTHWREAAFERLGEGCRFTGTCAFYSAQDEKRVCDFYSKGTLTHWMPGERPVYFKYNDNFEAEICGHVYCRNLPGALVGTPWEYCPVTAFYEHSRRR